MEFNEGFRMYARGAVTAGQEILGMVVNDKRIPDELKEYTATRISEVTDKILQAKEAYRKVYQDEEYKAKLRKGCQRLNTTIL